MTDAVDDVGELDDLPCEEVDLDLQGNPAPQSLESLALLVCTKKVKDIELRVAEEFEDLKKRQAQVRYLHKLLKVVNARSDNKGKFDASQDSELKRLLDEAAGMGIMLPNGNYKFNAEETNRLIDSIRMTCDDLNLQNEMQMQTISRMTNERYEAYQMTRSIMRPLHEDKVNKARAIAGR
jgi:hypothetical protein